MRWTPPAWSSTVREDLANGLATVVGERGVTLSGGQKQRATLARGLIRDAKVLLLDDCFSSVDTETEENILSGLQRLRGDKTTLLISHRVSTARHADRIYVDRQRAHVLESGSHERAAGEERLLRRAGGSAEQPGARPLAASSALLHDLEAGAEPLAAAQGERVSARRAERLAGAQLLGLRRRADPSGAQSAAVPAPAQVDQALPHHLDQPALC